ncbi:hypothetical protein FRC03_010090 [Tulasnella sp. 419]|nr:hypothetical protein FRC03_010090 [Tulasnella sp. 419]
MGNAGAGRKRKDETTQETLNLHRTRQPSIGSGIPVPPSPAGGSSASANLVRPRLAQAFDGVIGESWTTGTKRRPSDPRLNITKSEERLEASWRTGISTGRKENITEETSGDWDHNLVRDAGQSEELNRATPLETDVQASAAPETDSTNKLPLFSGDTGLNDQGQEYYDPERVNWIYKDPTGQIQGPFPASLMQTWFSGGYFNEDLLLQRIGIDDTFEPLRDFRRRVLPPGTEVHLFLSHIAPKGLPILHPPGLVDTKMTQISPTPKGLSYNEILSPNVSRPDSFITPSSSSFPLEIAATEISPHRIPPSVNASTSSAVEIQRRDRELFLRSLREQELAAMQSHVHPTGNDAFRLDSTIHVTGPVQPTVPLGRTQGLTGDATPTSPLVDPSQPYRPLHSLPQQPYIEVTRPEHDQKPPLASPEPILYPLQSTGSLWDDPSQRRPHQSVDDVLVTAAPPAHDSSPWLSIIQPFRHAETVSTQSALSHPSDFNAMPQADASFENPQVPNIATHQLYNPEVTIGPVYDDHSPRSPSHITLLDKAPSLLAEQHDESKENREGESAVASLMEKLTIVSHSDTPRSPASEPPDTARVPADRNSGIDTISAVLKTDGVAPASGSVASPSSSDPASTGGDAPLSSDTKGAPKPHVHQTTGPATPWGAPKANAWSTSNEEGASSLHPQPAISLRQIQEAEAKRNAEKKAEKENRTPKTPSASIGSITNSSAIEAPLSWGLPQVGRANSTPAIATSSPSLSSSAATPAAAWTSKAPQAAKKSMKEIQEEEEARRRKDPSVIQQQRDPNVLVSAGPKRGYADSAKSSAPNPASGGAWTTVGAGGKSNGPNASSTSSRPVAPPTPQSRNTSIPTPSATMTPSPANSNKQSSSKWTDDVPPPSLEFIKWMREALRGLTGVNIDEFIQMLLSFPLDPSDAVLEIISDSIYSNSSTLDGRRFAAEFVSKRKADAANAASTTQNTGQASTNGGSRISLADVVKTQPKQAQSEWAYKVVKKKAKKGGN